MSVSQAIHDFEILVRHGALIGDFLVDEFLTAYRAMEPSLHRYCNTPDVLDVDAFLYVLARLPEGIHRVSEILVQADLPDKLPRLEGLHEVVVPSRRRATFQLGPERMVIVAREGVTELLDLVTLLSAFVVEARKLENLLQRGSLQADLRAYIAEAPNQAEENRLLVRLAFDLGTTDDQMMALREVWGDQTLERLLCLVDHPPRLRVRLHREYSLQSALNRSRNWAQRLAQEISQRAPGRPLHILSSNTHSTVNLLSPFVRHYQDEILAWGEQVRPDLFHSQEICPENRVYVLLRSWLEMHPERNQEKRELLSQCGICVLSDHERVGVTAQFLDLERIPLQFVDARLGLEPFPPGQAPILVNFDYAFGDQAGVVGEQLFRELRNCQVRSFSIMGKAGSLVGPRGSLMLPNYLIREGTRDVYDIPNGNALESEDFRGLQVGEVFSGGPMLTVLGTILQNDHLLESYRDDWKALGLEMEGTPYIRAVHQALKLGWLPADLRVAVGYYASDSPLIPGESLARSLSLQGVDATYGLNIALLRKLLGSNK